MLFRCAPRMKLRCFSSAFKAVLTRTLVLSAAIASLAIQIHAADPLDTPALLRAADAAIKAGQPAEAIKLADKILAADPKDYRALFYRGRAYEESKDTAKALADYDASLKSNPKAAIVLQKRGELQFKLGNFAASIADFDKFIEAMPEQAPHHWQRGISLYYAARFEDGRKQFESHQTVNPYDVENAVWHFLCVARASGAEKAKAALIPIERDSRIPMMQILALFGGKGKPEDVLAAAKTGSAAQQENQLFYAHLYLGLYFEAIGDAKLAREHILKAATGFKAEHYMGDVARVHAQVLRKQSK